MAFIENEANGMVLGASGVTVTNLDVKLISQSLLFLISNVLDLRNLQEQIKKAFCFKNCIVRINFPRYPKMFAIFCLQPQSSKCFLDHLNILSYIMPPTIINE